MKNIKLTALLCTAFLMLTSLIGDKGNTKSSSLFNDNMPIGSVIIWAGEDAPNGWEKCRGQLKSKSTNQELYSAIGGYWNTDEGTGVDFFELPDLRGVFLRGVNDNRTDEYKDEGVRKSTNGNPNDNYRVGSFQQDSFQEHNHGGGNHNHGGGAHNHGGGAHNHGGGNHRHGLPVYDGNNKKRNLASAAYIGTVSRGTATTGSSGAIIKNSGNIIKSSGNIIDYNKVIDAEGLQETTPKNAYVHYIIKVKN